MMPRLKISLYERGGVLMEELEERPVDSDCLKVHTLYGAEAAGVKVGNDGNNPHLGKYAGFHTEDLKITFEGCPILSDKIRPGEAFWGYDVDLDPETMGVSLFYYNKEKAAKLLNWRPDREEKERMVRGYMNDGLSRKEAECVMEVILEDRLEQHVDCIRRIFITQTCGTIKVTSKGNKDVITLTGYNAEFFLRVDEFSGDKVIQETFFRESGGKVVRLYEY